VSTNPNPTTARLLSLLVPGVGQLYAGQRGVGIAVLCTVAGILLSAVAFRSPITLATMAVLYAVVALSASGDAVRVAAGAPSAFKAGTRWQIVLLLVTIGPFALPLLWQSQRFSQTAKILWTAFVILIAVSSVLILGALGPAMEQLLGEVSGIQ
jgi:hypothetical protein